MPDYQLEFLQEAVDDLSRLDGTIRRRIWKRLEWLRLNLDSIAPEPLTGKLLGLYKLRSGDYRVIYEIIRNQERIIVHAVGHRRDVYR